jgi:hypothetical protein
LEINDMTQTPLADDIAFVRQIAEEGQTTPSLSGRFRILWGSLTGFALIAHWLAMKEVFILPIEYIGAVWLGVGVVGGIASALLGRALDNKPGASSVGNQAQQAAWPVTGGGIFLYAAAIAFVVVGRGQSVVLFDTIMPVAFFAYAINEAMAARLFRRRQSHFLCAVALVFCAGTTALIGTAEVYLLAAIGVIATQFLPGIIALRREPSTIV